MGYAFRLLDTRTTNEYVAGVLIPSSWYIICRLLSEDGNVAVRFAWANRAGRAGMAASAVRALWPNDG